MSSRRKLGIVLIALLLSASCLFGACDVEAIIYQEAYNYGYDAGQADGYDAGQVDGYDAGYIDGYLESTDLVVQFFCDDELYKEITINYDDTDITVFPAAPKKDGFDFMGWFWDKDIWAKPFIDISFILSAKLTGMITLHAKFESSVGVIINQVYGLGNDSDDGQAISHSFIELYNTTDSAVSLNGFSLHAAGNNMSWQKLDLSGTISGKHSFLIVMTRFSNSSARLMINDYDMAWQNAQLNNKGFKVALLRNTDFLKVANPFDDGTGNRILGYVDMIGVAGNDDGSMIDGYEAAYLSGGGKGNKNGNSKQRAIRRIEFADTDNNADDCETLDYRTADLKFAPRSAAFGAWMSADDACEYGALSQFPSMYIDTSGVAINSKDAYIPASVSLRNTTNDFSFNDSGAMIRGRGNFSWKLEKKPYRIKFDTSREMFGTGYRARDWVLLAAHNDRSLLRNYGPFSFAQTLGGMNFVPNAWFVDVYLNAEYAGVYVLTDQVQQNEGRAELVFDSDPEKCEYLIELNGYAPEEGEEGVDYVVVGGTPYSIKFPESLSAGHIVYVKEFLESAYDTAAYGDYNQIKSLFDLPSMLDFYFVQEFYKNTDAGWSSTYFQIKGSDAERRIEFGPVWDMDLSAGNIYRSPDQIDPEGFNLNRMWCLQPLFRCAELKQEVQRRFFEIESLMESHIALLYEISAWFESSFKRNFARWNIFDTVFYDTPPVFYTYTSFNEHVTYVIDFLQNRLDWMRIYFSADE